MLVLTMSGDINATVSILSDEYDEDEYSRVGGLYSSPTRPLRSLQEALLEYLPPRRHLGEYLGLEVLHLCVLIQPGIRGQPGLDAGLG
jgi:hypothetical protein